MAGSVTARPSPDPITDSTAFADVLEDFASSVTRLPGVSRTQPHLFAEAKDSLAKAMMRRAAELRHAVAPRRDASVAIAAGAFRAGTLRLGHGSREIPIEIRRRRAF